MDSSLDIRDMLSVVKRRKWWFIGPATAILAVAIALLVLMPPIYRSKATILIESQEVPQDLVPALVSDYIDRRLDVLTRRVLLKDNLMRLIDRYELYPNLREHLTQIEVAERMSRDIGVQVLSTEVNDPRTGNSSDMTVAFEVQFDYPNPQIARRVVDELVSLYLATNQERRRGVIEQTTTFFQNEREALEQKIDQLEDELAAFRQHNADLLPRAVEFTRVQLANVDERLQDLRSSLRSLQEREGFLQTQLALTKEYETFEDVAVPGATPESKLELARAELASARARYSATHPDVIRLEREVRSLESVVGARGGVTALVARESELAAELGQLQQRYTAEHPDVQRVQAQLASVRDSLEDVGGAVGGGGAAGMRERNSAYVQLKAQLNSVQAEIRAITEQQGELQEVRQELQAQLGQAPLVEQEFLELNRRLETAIEERDEVAEKARTAGLSGSLEASSIGEQFVLAEPATVPRKPVRPSEKLILALGLVLAVGGGGASVMAAEMLDRSVRSAAQLARIVGETPLAMIPQLTTVRENRRRWLMRLLVVAVAIACVVGLLVWIDRAVMPLIVMFYEVQNAVDAWLAANLPWILGSAGG